MKYFTTDGTPITLDSIVNPFLKYYGNSFAISKNAGLLNNYILLMITRFEQACTDVKGMIDFLGGYLDAKYTKRRKTIYALLNDLDNLRKTMVRAQQIQKAQINRLGKERLNGTAGTKCSISSHARFLIELFTWWSKVNAPISVRLQMIKCAVLTLKPAKSSGHSSPRALFVSLQLFLIIASSSVPMMAVCIA